MIVRNTESASKCTEKSRIGFEIKHRTAIEHVKPIVLERDVASFPLRVGFREGSKNVQENRIPE